MVTEASPPDPLMRFSWSRSRGHMVASTRAHVVDPADSRGRALCGVRIPSGPWCWITRAERGHHVAGSVQQVWLDDDGATSTQPTCLRCEALRSRADRPCVTVEQWHARAGVAP